MPRCCGGATSPRQSPSPVASSWSWTGSPVSNLLLLKAPLVCWPVSASLRLPSFARKPWWWVLHGVHTDADDAKVTGGQAFSAALPATVPWNFTTLFSDNHRAIRARWPNGNPTDVSGQCFSKTQYPEHGEGCRGYASGGKMSQKAGTWVGPLPSGPLSVLR